MATSDAAGGMDHPTVVPENYDPSESECDDASGDDEDHASGSDEGPATGDDDHATGGETGTR